MGCLLNRGSLIVVVLSTEDGNQGLAHAQRHSTPELLSLAKTAFHQVALSVLRFHSEATVSLELESLQFLLTK